MSRLSTSRSLFDFAAGAAHEAALTLASGVLISQIERRVAVEAPGLTGICNPSIARGAGEWLVAARKVNYRIAPEGGLLIEGGVRNLDSQTWLFRYDDDLRLVSCARIDDADAKAGAPEALNGLEDPRLMVDAAEVRALWSANRLGATDLRETVTDRPVFPNWGEARSVMAVGSIVEGRVERLRLLPSPYGQSREKNWMPFVREGALRVIYHPASMEIYDATSDGLALVHRATRSHAALARWSGSSQVIAWEDGWLCVVHLAGRRLHRLSRRLGPYYLHRFVRLSRDFDVVALSAPFFFERRGVEFCAGLAAHEDRVMISYGVEDRRGAMVEMRAEAVADLLTPVST